MWPWTIDPFMAAIWALVLQLAAFLQQHSNEIRSPTFLSVGVLTFVF